MVVPHKQTSPTLADIQRAIDSNDVLVIKAIGEAHKKPRKIQEGVTAEEVRQQILQLAPGKHPLIGPLLLDLADKL